MNEMEAAYSAVTKLCFRNRAEASALRTMMRQIAMVTVELGHNPCIEIGSYLGDSSKIIVASGLFPLICVDPWKNGYDKGDDCSDGPDMDMVLHQFGRRTEAERQAGRIIVFRGESSSLLPAFAWNKVRMVYIDGDHRYESVVRDLQIAKSILGRGGVIAGHDYDMASVYAALADVVPNIDGGTSLYQDGCNWWFQPGA